MEWILCYIKHTFYILRLYEAIRSTLLDRLRYTMCVIRVQTCIITSNCRCPQVSIISDVSCSETVDGKQNLWSQTDRQWQHRNGILIQFTTDLLVLPTNDLRIVSCGCIILKTRGCRKAWLFRSPMCSHCNGQTCSNTSSLPGIQSLEDDP